MRKAQVLLSSEFAHVVSSFAIQSSAEEGEQPRGTQFATRSSVARSLVLLELLCAMVGKREAE